MRVDRVLALCYDASVMRFLWMMALLLVLVVSCKPSPDTGSAGDTSIGAVAGFPAFDTMDGTRWSGSYLIRGNPPCEGVVEGVVELVLAVDGNQPMPFSQQARTDVVGAPISGAARLDVIMEVQDDGTCWVSGPHEYRFDGELGDLYPSGPMDFTLRPLSQVGGSEVLFMPSGTLKADGGVEGDLFTGGHYPKYAASAWLDLELVNPELAAAPTATPPVLIVPKSLPLPLTPDLMDLRSQMTGVTFGGFPRPQALAFDGKHIWIAHSGENTVTKLGQDGNVVATVNVGDGPRTILFAAGYIWVGNGRGGSVTKIDPSSLVADTYPLGGGYTAPIDLAHDGEFLWVVTSWGNAVYSMNMDGEVVNRIPIRGSHPSPWAIALEGDHLWVASLNLQEVQKFSRDGTLVARYKVSNEPSLASGYEETPGLGGQGPSGLAFDGKDMWVGINWEGKLIRLSLEGEVLTQVVVGGWPGHLTFDGRYIWTPAWGASMILRVDIATGETGFFSLDSPSAVVSAGDALWAASLFGDSLLKLIPGPSSTEVE